MSGPNIIKRSLNMEEGSRRVSVRVISMRKTPVVIAGLEDGSRPSAKECRQPLESGRGTKRDSPLEPAEGPSNTLTLAR